MLLGAWLLSGCATQAPADPARDALTVEEHLQLGVGFERKGEYEAALRHYRYVAEQDYPEGYVFLGNFRLNRGQLEAAEQAFREALQLRPGYADAQNNLAWCLVQQGDSDLDEAERLVRAALASDPPPKRRSFYQQTLAAILNAKEADSL